MNKINVEIKAKVTKGQLEDIRSWLTNNPSRYEGLDQQTDTYFKVPNGRLKLRRGNAENALVQYERPDQAGPKVSNCVITKVSPDQGEHLRASLINALGVWVEVKKLRDIYFVHNIKIHLDTVEALGFFVEIEASNEGGDMPVARLHEQCQWLIKEFKLTEDQFLKSSYSDMMLRKLSE